MVCATAFFLFALASPQQSSDAASQAGSEPKTTQVDPALEADIRRLMEDVGVKELLSGQIDRMAAPLAEMMKANPKLSSDLVDEFVVQMKKKLLGGPLEDLMVQEYAKFFTREEIKQMIVFHESPVGRKEREVLPQMQAETGEKSKQLGQQIAREVMLEVGREHPEYFKNPAPTTGTGGTADGGVTGGVLGSVPPPPPPSHRGELQKDFTGPRIDPETQEAHLIKKVEPVYPPLAKSARVQGTVRFSIIVGIDGKVESLNLISGHPLLVNAAREAVLQWVYEPTMLDGKAVEVLTEVKVNFHLDM